MGSAPPLVSAAELARILEPLMDWEFLSGVEKRLLLQTLIPEIHIENYGVTKLLVPNGHRDEITHTAAGYFIATPKKVYISIGLLT